MSILEQLNLSGIGDPPQTAGPETSRFMNRRLTAEEERLVQFRNDLFHLKLSNPQGSANRNERSKLAALNTSLFSTHRNSLESNRTENIHMQQLIDEYKKQFNGNDLI